MKLHKSNRDGWDDFVHSTRPDTFGALELLERFKAFREFFDQLPRKELVKRGWLRSPDDVASLAPVFFDLPLARNPTLFRKSATANESLLTVWLSQARTTAEYSCIAEGTPAFNALGKGDLRRLAQLSVDPAAIRDLPAILAEFGVILIYLPALPGMKADGAIFKLSIGHPVIALSLRFPRLDYFWFTLLHELAHLVLHGDTLDEPVFVDIENEEEEVAEKAANRLAKDSLVERSSWRNCSPKYQSGADAVVKYAREQRVHPSIVAGLLRRESRNYSRYGAIINEHDVRQIIFPS